MSVSLYLLQLRLWCAGYPLLLFQMRQLLSHVLRHSKRHLDLNHRHCRHRRRHHLTLRYSKSS